MFMSKHPLYLVSSDGTREPLYGTLDSFNTACKKVSTSPGYRIWYKDAYYQWSCGFCPKALAKFLGIFDGSPCTPQDCINLWKECIEDENTAVS